MGPNDEPRDTATDRYFATQPPAEEAEPEKEISPLSPIGDYTRELQQEYDAQQEEGKVDDTAADLTSPPACPR